MHEALSQARPGSTFIYNGHPLHYTASLGFETLSLSLVLMRYELPKIKARARGSNSGA